MNRVIDHWLDRCSIDTRQFRALVKAFVLMDFRSPHFASSTGTKPGWAISPLFWVFGQCLAISAVSSLILFLRVSAWAYACVGLAVSMLVLATTVLVEFHEVVFQPRDLTAISPHPVDARTYSAARFANLLLYVGMMFAALNLFPTVVGAGLEDASWWYAPAYLTATTTGSIVTVCLVVLALCGAGSSRAVEEWKAILAWTQIALFAFAAYGGQLMFRNPGQATEVWFAFPPDWVHWLPPAWLAWFVDRACASPGVDLLYIAAGMLVGTLCLVVLTLRRIANLYGTMQPLPAAHREHLMSADRIGMLPGPAWFRRHCSVEFRVGWWLAWKTLRENAAHRMRCLYPANLAVAVTLLGLLTGQFGNPLNSSGLIDGVPAPEIVMPVLAIQLVALSMPLMLLNLTFSEWHAAAWVISSSPLEHPGRLATGALSVLQAVLVTPLCLLLGICMVLAWNDPVSAVLHVVLAWELSLLAGMASVTFVIPDLPLTRPASRGGTLGTAILPLSALSCVASLVGVLHLACGRSHVFWGCVLVAIPVATVFTERGARRRFSQPDGGPA